MMRDRSFAAIISIANARICEKCLPKLGKYSIFEPDFQKIVQCLMYSNCSLMYSNCLLNNFIPLKVPLQWKIVDLVLIAAEQHFRSRLNGAFSLSISCLVSEIFMFLKHANYLHKKLAFKSSYSVKK